ncbi:MAG TPA: hypothetical protein VG013_06820 [Gemmataceae bacterium]|nr:hypothetical protein [Gemmataceae bacterium]
MGALAKKEVGDYLNEYFVSSFRKVGTFRIVNGQKQGGNVASYFCTTDGRVLHAVVGPVDAATLLREARWVVETFQVALLESKDDSSRFKAFWRKAHAERLRAEHGLDVTKLKGGRQGWPALDQQGRVHLLLAAAPLVKIEQVYKLIFEKVLREKVSTNPVIQEGTP